MRTVSFVLLVSATIGCVGAFAAPPPGRDPAMSQFVGAGDFGRDTVIAPPSALDCDYAMAGNAAVADEARETKRKDPVQTAAGILGWGVLGIMGTAIGLATTTLFLLFSTGGPSVGGC